MSIFKLTSCSGQISPPSPIPCPREGCNRELATKVELYNHLRMHRGYPDFKCNVCGDEFFMKKSLELHMRSHDERSTPSITIQSARGRRPGLMGRLLDIHQQVEEIQIKKQEKSVDAPTDRIKLFCASCFKEFWSNEHFQAHICKGHPSTPTPCPWEGCNRQLATKVGLYNHLRMHREYTDYECNICGKVFLFKKTLDTHVKRHNEKSIPCLWEGCKRKWATKVGLFKHLRIHIDADTDIKCKVCYESCLKRVLQSHMKYHGERSISSITICRARGLRPGLMGRSLDIHQQVGEIQIKPVDAPTDVVQLMCAECLNTFKSDENFQAHICRGYIDLKDLKE